MHLCVLHKRHQLLHVRLDLGNGLESFKHLLVGREGIICLWVDVRGEGDGGEKGGREER